MKYCVSRINQFCRVALIVFGIAAMLLSLPCLSALGQSATTTALTLTAGGSAVTSISSKTVVTLTATVKVGFTPVTKGQVKFCDASVTYCTDIHLLGVAQQTSSGTASIKFRPGPGSHSYKAVFSGTSGASGSLSDAVTLAVESGATAVTTSTSFQESGSWGSYKLIGTVTEIGGTAPLTGTVSFIDLSKENSVLGTPSLGTSTSGWTWVNSQTSLPNVAPGGIAVGDFNGDGIPDFAVTDTSSNNVRIYLGKADGTFTAATPINANNRPSQIVAADFNGDGILDLAFCVNSQSGKVFAYLGNGDGTFTAAPSNSSVGSYPGYLTVGDFNGDGLPDLAVANSYSGTVSILLGNGDGTFTTQTQSITNSSTLGPITTGDFNSDGILDLAVEDFSSYKLVVLTGKGDGTFVSWSSSTSLSGYASSMSITAADFNSDGKPDLVVGGTFGDGPVAVLLNNGDGTFKTSYLGSQNYRYTYAAVGDFNGDGIPDIVSTQQGLYTATVFFGTGDGTFADASIQPVVSTNYQSAFPIAAVDFNADGRDDFAIVDPSNNLVDVLYSEPMQTASTDATSVSPSGTGLHQFEASYGGTSSYAASVSSTMMLWGQPAATNTTLALTSGGSSASTVAYGSVVTLTATVLTGSTAVTPGQVNFCDATAKACTDIHLLGSAQLTTSGTATLKFVPGPGDHSYKAVFVENGHGQESSSSAVSLTVGSGSSPVYSDNTTISSSGSPGNYTLTATVEGLGGSTAPTGSVSFLDSSYGNTVLASASLGKSTSGTGWLISQSPSIANNLVSEVTGDFNGDGVPDLAVLWSGGSSNAYAITILIGKGDGTFTTGSTTQVTLSGYNSATPSLLANDFNGNGKADLAVLSISSNPTSLNVAVFPVNGDGTFSASKTTSVSISNSNCNSGSLVEKIADFDGDGILDLAVSGSCYNSDGIVILIGKGDGTFTTGTTLSSDQGVGQIATGDFNGDGIPDLVAANSNGTTATVFLGKGDGTFTSAAALTISSSYSTIAAIAVGDFNKDGILDLAFSGADGIAIYIGVGDGTFNETSGSPVAVPSLLQNLIAGDFNHDGEVDLAGLDNSNQQIVLLSGAGDGSFPSTSTSSQVSQSWYNLSALVAADFNGDGAPDLALMMSSSATVSVLLTEPTQTTTATVTGIAPVGAATHNVEAKYAGDSNYGSSVSSTVALTAGMAPVTFSPASGVYTSSPAVTLSESIPGGTIYYSASGPFATDGYVQYTGPISFSYGGTETITAYATETGYEQSTSSTATYALNLPAAPSPVISPASGVYSGNQTVTITDTAQGATICYATAGVTPYFYTSSTGTVTCSGTVYSAPFTAASTDKVSAVARVSGYSDSAVSSASYFTTGVATPMIYTVAGTGTVGFSGDNGQAVQAQIGMGSATAVDGSGNLYIADSTNNRVRKVDATTGIITSIAGTGIAGFSGDGGKAVDAQISSPNGLVFDSAGNLYISDSGNGSIRKINLSSGLISTVVGNGTRGYSPDGTAASSAQQYNELGIAVDSAGNIYIADIAFGVRKVSAASNTISTIVKGVYSGGMYTLGVATDSAGNVFYSQFSTSSYAGMVYKIAAGSSSSTLVVDGSCQSYGYCQSGTVSVPLRDPLSLAVDGTGHLYIADAGYYQIIQVDLNAKSYTSYFCGSTGCNLSGGDGGAAAFASAYAPAGLSLDASGNIYIGDGNARIRKIINYSSPPSTATATPTFSVAAGSYSTSQSVTISDSTSGASIYYTLDGSTPTSSSKGYAGPINISGSATLQAIAIAPGNLPSDAASAAYTVSSLPDAVISTVAGSGIMGSDLSMAAGLLASNAELGTLQGVAVDNAGNLYIADSGNSVIWKVSALTGIVKNVAGNGTSSYACYSNSGEGGQASDATLCSPTGIVLDSAGNLYIAEYGANRVRRVDAATGIITTVAGNGNTGGGGDKGLATQAQVGGPMAVALDSTGNLYIADFQDYHIRKVDSTTGIITTVAGNGIDTISGDGGPATSASIGEPTALAVDSAGNLYIGSYNNPAIRKVTIATGVISTIAGGDAGYSGDGGPATSANLYVSGLAVDPQGNIYFSNGRYLTISSILIRNSTPPSIGNVVRRILASTGVVTTVAGSGIGGYWGDGGSATIAGLYGTGGLAFDSTGSLYIADGFNYRIRKVTFASNPAQVALPEFSLASGTYAGTQNIIISTTTPGAVIYYTTDGSTPTISSTVYSGAISVAASETIQAMAVANGYFRSNTASANYVILNNPTPVLNTLSPAYTSAGGAAFTLTVTGTGFVSGSTIYSGSTALATTYVSATQLTAQVPASVIASTGTLAITVQTPTPGGGTSNSMSFEVDSSESSSNAPTLTTLEATVSAGTSATFTVTVPSTATIVSVNCLNLPKGATCSYSSGKLTIATSSSTPVGTYQITAVFTESVTTSSTTTALVLLPFLLLPLMLMRNRLKKRGLWVSTCLAVVLLTGATFVVGCGGGGSGGNTGPETHTKQVTSSVTINLTVK